MLTPEQASMLRRLSRRDVYVGYRHIALQLCDRGLAKIIEAKGFDMFEITPAGRAALDEYDKAQEAEE